MKISNKKIDKFILKFESHCVAGDIRPLETIISQYMGTYFLKRFREKKIIYRIPVKYRRDVISCLLSYTENLGHNEYNALINYIEFTIAVDTSRRQLLGSLRKKIRQIGNCSTLDFICLSSEIYELEATRIHSHSMSKFRSEKVADNEKRLHDSNGYRVDLSNALSRLLNEISRTEFLSDNHSSLKRKERKRSLVYIRDALTIAGELNALEWIFDEVSFGHFVVECINTERIKSFKLGFMDEKVALMRRLATRRTLVLKLMNSREERYVRNELSKLHNVILDYLLECCCIVAGINELSPIEVENAKQQGLNSLIIIDAEDDLLFTASRGDVRVQSYYTAGLILNCFAIANRIVREKLREAGVKTPIINIPLSKLAEGIDFGEANPYIAEALVELSTTLPARSYTNVNALQFIRHSNNSITPFLNGFSGMWNIIVRNALIKGGKTGNEVGAIWEDFTQFSFEGTAWKIIKKGIRLRSKGQELTDIDLLLQRDDLLLVMQIKAMIGAADTAHDHWKNRQIVEVGCMQARKSADFLKENPETLLSICGKKAFEKVRIIQPVVFTNIAHMEGFNLYDVPVIGSSARKAICRGAKVDYFTSDGKKIHTHEFLPEEQLNTEEIIRLLKEPIELKVSTEKPESLYREECLGNLNLLVPEFVEKTDTFQPDFLGIV